MSFSSRHLYKLICNPSIGAKMEVLVNGGATGGGEFLPQIMLMSIDQ
jgi:hypothetical protein